MKYNYRVRVPLTRHHYFGNDEAVKEVKGFLEQNLKSPWRVAKTTYCEAGDPTWYCTVFLDDKEDAARLVLLRDGKVMM